MSRSTLFDRTVDLEITADSGTIDGRGNEVRSTSTIADVPAYRSQLTADEDTADRDQQARTFTYLLPVEHGVYDVAALLTGRDRIVDGDDRLQVLGSPIVATSRGRRMHVEVRAFLTEG